MFEIIPNWHPLFVHFTVALFTTSVGFYILTYLSKIFKVKMLTLSIEFEIVARWCLWASVLATFITVLAGLYAYNTVQHDEISHKMMINHRNWALPTAGAMALMAFWSAYNYLKHKKVGGIFIVFLLLVQGSLLSTAWRGGELVYRYGLGVISLPNIENTNHHHHQSSLAISTEENYNHLLNDSNQHHHK